MTFSKYDHDPEQNLKYGRVGSPMYVFVVLFFIPNKIGCT